MYKLLRYFYYVLYKFTLSNNTDKLDAKFVPYWIIVFLVELNFIILFQILDCFFKIDFSSYLKIYYVVFILCIFYLFYILLIKHNKSLKILVEFENIDRNTKVMFNFICFIYTIGTLVLFFILL